MLRLNDCSLQYNTTHNGRDLDSGLPIDKKHCPIPGLEITICVLLNYYIYLKISDLLDAQKEKYFMTGGKS